MSVFREIVAELTRGRGDFAFSVYSDKGQPRRDFLRVRSGTRHVILSWTPDEGLTILSHPYAPEIRWQHSHQQADAVMDLLRVSYAPYDEVEFKPIPPEHVPLLPLARMVAGNVYGALDPYADAHLAMRMLDGLHDDFPEVRGALDGLVAAREQGYWRLEQLGYDRWDREKGYERVNGPEPVERVLQNQQPDAALSAEQPT